MSSLELIHWTNLRQMALSPAHYMAAVRSELHKRVWSNGRLLHYLVLGGDYVVWNGRRQGNAWKEFAAENDHRDIFTQTEVDREMRVAEAIKSHPIASPLLEGRHEVEIQWKWMGRDCSSRIDVLNTKLRRAVDLKRAVTARPERFQRSAIFYGYHAQGAFYQDACEANQTPIDEYYVIAAEPFPPYAITVFQLTPRALVEGRKQNRLWRERLDGCQAQNFWPEYAQTIQPLDFEAEPELIFDGEEEAANDDDGEEAAE